MDYFVISFLVMTTSFAGENPRDDESAYLTAALSWIRKYSQDESLKTTKERRTE